MGTCGACRKGESDVHTAIEQATTQRIIIVDAISWKFKMGEQIGFEQKARLEVG